MTGQRAPHRLGHVSPPAARKGVNCGRPNAAFQAELQTNYTEAAMTDVPLLNGLIFAVLGILIFVIAFSLVVRLAPLDLWKEIAQERNTAVAILAGAVALGICWIIAATMH